MSIRLICLCGRGMSLPEKYAGQHVQCPNCHAMLRIPSAKEDLKLTRWFCKCGLRLKARARTGGRKLRCPRCSAEVAVPLAHADPSYFEENFLLDEASGIVQKVAGGPLSLEPEAPDAGRKSAKDEDVGVYELEPPPDAKPAPPLRPPTTPPKTKAGKRKKRPSRKATEEESWAEDADK